MKVWLAKFFKRKKFQEDYDRETEQCRKIALIEAYKQRDHLRHSATMCMRFQAWNINDISMR